MDRLGISVPLEGMPLAALGALAREAEELGYTDAWSMEVNGLDAFTPLAAVAAATTRMRLGTAIVPAFLRSSGLLAMHAAAMAELAPGRFVLGVGSSTPVVVESWHGVPFAKPLTRTRTAVSETRALLAGEKVGGMRLARAPGERVPIFMAALGEKMLAAAGEVADGLSFFMTGPRIIPELLNAAAGHGIKLDSMARVVVIPGDGEAQRALARRLITSYAIVPYYGRVMGRQGFGAEVDAISARWRSGDRAGAAGQVSDAMIAELLLLGSIERILEGVQRYRAGGLGVAALSVAGTPEEAMRTLRELAPRQAR